MNNEWEKFGKDIRNIVEDAVSQIERISGVVQENVQISSNTKQVSSNMAEVAGRLLDIVE